MNELIKINVKEDGSKLISARELHEFLGVGRDFTNWIKGRIARYDFEENVDFTVVWNDAKTGDVVNYNGNTNSMVRLGYQCDFAITIDMAKELCMVENNELGRKARKYFIECEKKLNTPTIMTEKDKVNLELDIIERAAKILNLNDNSKLVCMNNVLTNHNIPTNILPKYTDSKGQLLPATELLKRNNIAISTIKFNKLMIQEGIIKELERPSSKGIKKFKSLIDTRWGENQVSDKNPKETQVLYYENKFEELLQKLNLL